MNIKNNQKFMVWQIRIKTVFLSFVLMTALFPLSYIVNAQTPTPVNDDNLPIYPSSQNQSAALAVTLTPVNAATTPVASSASNASNNVNTTRQAQLPTTNVTSSYFKLSVCDGPVLPKDAKNPKENYVPCDFRALMVQVQHLINVAIVVGVLIAIGGFSYAGFLYMKGSPADRTHANNIFQNVFIGFIIMLSAWFIVYQIIAWFAVGGSGFSALLGGVSK